MNKTYDTPTTSILKPEKYLIRKLYAETRDVKVVAERLARTPEEVESVLKESQQV